MRRLSLFSSLATQVTKQSEFVTSYLARNSNAPIAKKMIDQTSPQKAG